MRNIFLFLLFFLLTGELLADQIIPKYDYKIVAQTGITVINGELLTDIYTPALNNNGQIAFPATRKIHNYTTGGDGKGYGIYIDDKAIVLDDGNTRIDDIPVSPMGYVSINDSGNIAYMARHDGCGYNGSGLFIDKSLSVCSYSKIDDIDVGDIKEIILTNFNKPIFIGDYHLFTPDAVLVKKDVFGFDMNSKGQFIVYEPYTKQIISIDNKEPEYVSLFEDKIKFPKIIDNIYVSISLEGNYNGSLFLRTINKRGVAAGFGNQIKFDTKYYAYNYNNIVATQNNIVAYGGQTVGNCTFEFGDYHSSTFQAVQINNNDQIAFLAACSDGSKAIILATPNNLSPAQKLHSVLLLHGMNSDLNTWDKLVKANSGFDSHCYDPRAADFNSVDPVANSEGVHCFRINFGTLDNLATAPKGLGNKTCVSKSGCKGDYSTFEMLGKEVESAIKNIVTKLGTDTEIILLGHSRGGLAARTFLQSSSPEKNSVVGLITTGTPHAGSPLGRYYFYLNDHCVPESKHINKFDSCSVDWNFVNSYWIKGAGALDLKAPTVGFLAEESTDFIKDNPYAIKQLNSDISKSPSIKYAQLFYSGIDFGCLGGVSDTGCGYNIFNPLGTPIPSENGLMAATKHRPRKSLDGDGIVLKSSQQISELTGFPFPASIQSIGDGKRVHIAEPSDIPRLSKALNNMYKSLGWVP